jgi:hypothetical protein
LMGRDSAFLQIMSIYGFAQKTNHRKGQEIRFKAQESWWRLKGIHCGFTCSTHFQKAGLWMPSTTMIIFSRHVDGKNVWFMQTMPDHTQLEIVMLLHKKETATRRTLTVFIWCRVIRLLSLRTCQTLFGRNAVSIMRRITCTNSWGSGRDPEEALQAMFDHWMERIEWVSQNDNCYL